MDRPELDLDPRTLALAQERTAMKDPEHLRRFLLSSDRKFLVLNALDMVDGLPWPSGHEALIQCVSAYHHQRQGQLNGLATKETVVDELRGGRKEVEVKMVKHELLEPDEIDEAILQLQRLKNKILDERKKAGAYVVEG